MQYGQDYSLEITSEAVYYNQWIYDLMYPYLGTRVLELGAGIGVMTPFFLREGREVMAIDIDEQLIHRHRQRVAASPRLTVSCASIQELAAKNEYREAFDAVVSSNVLEHIPDGTDCEAVIAMSSLLRPGGFAVHWVPACRCVGCLWIYVTCRNVGIEFDKNYLIRRGKRKDSTKVLGN